MFTQIIHNTPFWVWILLAALVALGYSQTRSRTISMQRVVIMPVAMILLSLYGTASAFGTVYDSVRRHYATPGSWLPMLVGTLYGLFSGFFAGRTLRLLRLALPVTAR